MSDSLWSQALPIFRTHHTASKPLGSPLPQLLHTCKIWCSSLQLRFQAMRNYPVWRMLFVVGSRLKRQRKKCSGCQIFQRLYYYELITMTNHLHTHMHAHTPIPTCTIPRYTQNICRYTYTMDSHISPVWQLTWLLMLTSKVGLVYRFLMIFFRANIKTI